MVCPAPERRNVQSLSGPGVTRLPPTHNPRPTARMQHNPQYRPPCGLRASGVARRGASVGDSGAALWAAPDGPAASAESRGSDGHPFPWNPLCVESRRERGPADRLALTPKTTPTAARSTARAECAACSPPSAARHRRWLAWVVALRSRATFCGGDGCTRSSGLRLCSSMSMAPWPCQRRRRPTRSSRCWLRCVRAAISLASSAPATLRSSKASSAGPTFASGLTSSSARTACMPSKGRVCCI